MNQISKHLIHWQLSFFHELGYFFHFYSSHKVYPTNKHRMSLFLAKKLFLVCLFYFSAMWNLTGSQNLAYFCVVVVNLLNSFISYQLLLLLVVFFLLWFLNPLSCVRVCVFVLFSLTLLSFEHPWHFVCICSKDFWAKIVSIFIQLILIAWKCRRISPSNRNSWNELQLNC